MKQIAEQTPSPSSYSASHLIAWVQGVPFIIRWEPFCIAGSHCVEARKRALGGVFLLGKALLENSEAGQQGTNSITRFNLGAIEFQFIIRPVCFLQYLNCRIWKKSIQKPFPLFAHRMVTAPFVGPLFFRKRDDNKFMDMALNILLLLNMQQCNIASKGASASASAPTPVAVSVAVQTHKTIACNNWMHCTFKGERIGPICIYISTYIYGGVAKCMWDGNCQPALADNAYKL